MTFFSCDVYSQLRKVATVEQVKSFNAGNVVLLKTTGSENEIYSLKLSSSSRYYEPVILYLGSEDEMVKNLTDFKDALQSMKDGDVFDFSACGYNYVVTYHPVLFERCVKIREEYSSLDDYGILLQSTIKRILKFIEKENATSKKSEYDEDNSGSSTGAADEYQSIEWDQ